MATNEALRMFDLYRQQLNDAERKWAKGLASIVVLKETHDAIMADNALKIDLKEIVEATDDTVEDFLARSSDLFEKAELVTK